MNVPAISIIMSVYNGEQHLAETMNSILAQTFGDFECIVIDDASTDATRAILAEYARRDARVRVLTNKVNMERSRSRNKAILAAQSPLIAVMDADDWAHPQRLEKQYAFMQAHPEVTVCGTVLEIYETGELVERALDDTTIRLRTLFNAAIAHPTAMFRKEPVLRLVGGYNVSRPPAEDFDLWARLAMHDTVRFANLSDVLLRYRAYPGKERGDYYAKQKETVSLVCREQIRRLGIEPTEAEMRCHAALEFGIMQPCLQDVYACWQWRRKLLAYNARAQVYEQTALRAFLHEKGRTLTQHYKEHGAWRAFCLRVAPDFVRRWYRSIKTFLK